MKTKSLKYNFFMATIRMFTGVLFPILIMPYINRLFTPTLIGEFEYVNTIVVYFVILTYLGIPTYGVREISKYKSSKVKLSIIFWELVSILLVMNLITYILYFIFLFYFEKNSDLKQLFYIFGLNIFFTTIGFEWFYQGIEDQKIITKRTVFTRIISIILIFLFIKTKDDFIKYVWIYNLAIVGGNLFNIFYLKKYITFNKIILKKLSPLKHLKSILVIFSSSIAMIIYGQMDILMLGKLSQMENVGLYTTAIKFVRMLTSIIPLFGTTLLPRATSLYFDNKIDDYKIILEKTLKFLLMYSVLGFTLLVTMSNLIIQIFAGKNYIESVWTLKLLSIIVVLSGLSYFLGIIILYSQKKEKIFLFSLISAAILNLILNYVLIPLYNQNGAVIATIFAEILVIISVLLFSKKYLCGIKIFTEDTLKYFLASFGCFIIWYIYLKDISIYNLYLNFLLKSICITCVYVILLLILKENITKQSVKFILKKL